ncbi:MAG: glycosyltransferase, partial [Casimicrobium sp.]
CIESCAPFLSGIAAVDTGSTDKTLSIIKNLAEQQLLKVSIIEEAWTDDFAFHRNNALLNATDLLGDKCVTLQLDADEQVKAGLSEAIALLESADVITGWLEDGDFRYQKHFLIRASSIHRWDGERHEQPVFVASTRRVLCQSLTVHYGNDGFRRSKPGFQRRDAIILADALESQISFRQAWLLGRTLESSNLFAEAIDSFRTALKASINHEQRFQSLWGIARATHQCENPRESIERYEELTSTYPHRAEGWLGLAQLTYEHGNFHKSFAAAQRATSCAEPTETMLYDRAACGWLSFELAARARMAMRRPELHLALNDFKHALEAMPALAEDRERIMRSISELSQALSRSADTEPT